MAIVVCTRNHCRWNFGADCLGLHALLLADLWPGGVCNGRVVAVWFQSFAGVASAARRLVAGLSGLLAGNAVFFWSCPGVLVAHALAVL